MNAASLAARITLVAEAIDSAGVTVYHLSVSRHGPVTVQTRDRAGVDALGDRLGLRPADEPYGRIANPLISRSGTWADIDIKVYGPARDEVAA